MSQLDLFNTGPPPDPQPTPIDGLQYLPGFLDADAQVALLREVDDRPWLNDLARRVQHYGYRYDYQARRVSRDMLLGELPPFLQRVATRLLASAVFAERPDQAIVNEYLPGQGISKHVDCVQCFGGTIASISLGSACEMEFQHRGQIRYLLLEAGSLLVLAGAARYTWTHAIRPRSSDHGRLRRRRVSITFRTVEL